MARPTTELLRPRTWAEALDLRAEHPDALIVQGGTDVLVDLNFGRARPDTLLDLSRVAELRTWERGDGHVRIGAGVTYADAVARAGDDLRALATAARTVGSLQIRNRGTIGGNLGTGSPAGDCHPPLLALDAEVELASRGGTRVVPVGEFFVGPRRTVLAPDELIAAVLVPAGSAGQEFAKVGTRNAMIIAACSFCVAIDPRRRRVRTGIGSAGPTPLRAREAEAFLEGVIEEDGSWPAPAPSPAALARFGELVAGAAQPIDDVRATARYRRHALDVMARRTLSWACEPEV